MTKSLKSSHTEKLGVVAVGKICALARTIFRPTSSDDVGIDGFIELTDQGDATGILIGVQIKSGMSFIKDNGSRFIFKSDRDHFGYWARCSFPVIAVIHSPEFERAVWLDVTSLCSDARIVNGPYSETISFTAETEFTANNLLSKITDVAARYTYQRRTLWQVRGMLQPQRPQATFAVPSLQLNAEKEIAWYALIDEFLSVGNDDREIADAGYRLSWYYPSVAKNLQDTLIKRLSGIDEFSLSKILCAIHAALYDNAENVAELLIDLLTYIPALAARIEALLIKGNLPAECKEAAIQTIEVIEQNERPELRDH